MLGRLWCQRELQPPLLHPGLRKPPTLSADLGIAGHGRQPDVTERVGGQPRIADGLLQERPERVTQLMKMKTCDAELACDLAAHMASAIACEAIPALPSRLRVEADDESGGRVMPLCEVIVHGRARLIGDMSTRSRSPLPHTVTRESATTSFVVDEYKHEADVLEGFEAGPEFRPRHCPAVGR